MKNLALIRQVFLDPLPRLLVVLAAAATSALASADEGRSARVPDSAAHPDRPILFEQYEGGTSPRFVARGPGYGLSLTGTESALLLASSPKDTDPCSTPIIIRMPGANASPRLSGRDELPGKSRYYVGGPSQWRTDVRRYSRVEYEDVYPRIDLAYYGHDGSLEYDFVVRPGGDLRRIRLQIDGADGIRLDGGGNLVLSVRGQEVVHRAPVVYQRIRGQRKTVAGRFVLRGPREVGFEVERYAVDHPLVLDPVLAYSSFLGGSRSDSGSGIAADVYGNAYVTGSTCSVNFPTKNAFQPGRAGAAAGFDVFVTKVSASGALVYSTYLGGGFGEGGAAIAVDPSGNVYVTGSTSSSDFPTLNALQPTKRGSSDAFVSKLDPNGALVYSTYLGGSHGDDPFGGIFGGPVTGGAGIAADGAGNAYIVGSTDATDFPTVNPIQATKGAVGTDVFVTKINPSGSALVYSTFLGGAGAGEMAGGIALDASGSAYIVGSTESPNFPTVNPIQGTFAALTNYDAFLAKLNPAGSALVYSTYLGGHLSDFADAVAVDAAGNAYVAGHTNSVDFPTVNPLQATHGGGFYDAFVAKVNAVGSSLVYSTYLGGSSLDYGYGVAVDGSGNAFLTGYAQSTEFPIVNPIQGWSGGMFLSELDPTGALVYSTRIGNAAGSGSAVASDPAGNIYLTGRVISSDFPTVNAFQPLFGGEGDAVVVRIGPLPVGDFTGNLHADLVWRNRSTGSSVVWFMDGSTLAGGAFLDPVLEEPTGRIVATPDLNGDGRPDIVWRSAKGLNVAWFMNGTTPTGAALLPPADPKWDIRAAVDLDADGKPDLVLRNETTGEVKAWLMNGTALKAVAPLPFVPDTNWQCYGGGDFNGDGKADLLWRNGSTGQITVWLMEGTTMVDGAWLPTIEDPRWKIVAVADYNGDGRPDIVWHHETSGDTIVWFMNGLVVFGGAVLPQVLDTDWTIVGPR